MDYWGRRSLKTQQTLSDKSIEDTEAQLAKYYKKTMKDVIQDFESTYLKLQETVEEGKTPTAADLYKLDKYWKMEAQLKEKLQKLGDKEVKLLSDNFVKTYQDVYKDLALPSASGFTTVDEAVAQQMVNQVWCADGKSWSERVWTNTEKLQETLNESLVSCVVAGKKPTYLKTKLKNDFGVGYNRADTLVRTEITHIEVMAAQQRYKDSGLQEMEIYTAEDERTCEICGKKHGTRISVYSSLIPPFHPNCRCTIIPIVK